MINDQNIQKNKKGGGVGFNSVMSGRGGRGGGGNRGRGKGKRGGRGGQQGRGGYSSQQGPQYSANQGGQGGPQYNSQNYPNQQNGQGGPQHYSQNHMNQQAGQRGSGNQNNLGGGGPPRHQGPSNNLQGSRGNFKAQGRRALGHQEEYGGRRVEGNNCYRCFGSLDYLHGVGHWKRECTGTLECEYCSGPHLVRYCLPKQQASGGVTGSQQYVQQATIEDIDESGQGSGGSWYNYNNGKELWGSSTWNSEHSASTVSCSFTGRDNEEVEDISAIQLDQVEG